MVSYKIQNTSQHTEGKKTYHHWAWGKRQNTWICKIKAFPNTLTALGWRRTDIYHSICAVKPVGEFVLQCEVHDNVCIMEICWMLGSFCICIHICQCISTQSLIMNYFWKWKCCCISWMNSVHWTHGVWRRQIRKECEKYSARYFVIYIASGLLKF